MSKKLGFALGAGGSRGVAHIGFLKAMEEEGIVPDVVTGSSMGAVVGACYSIGMTADDMYKVIVGLKKSDVLDLNANILFSQSLFRSKKMRTKLEEFLGNKKISDTQIPFACMAVDLITGEPVTLKGEDSLLDSVQASATIPGVFKPVKMGDRLLVDGAVRTRLPIESARELGADVIIAVDVLGGLKPTQKPFNTFSVLFRTLDIFDYSLTKNMVETLKPDLYLEPDMGTISQYKFKHYDISYKAGYDVGKANADKIKKLIKETTNRKKKTTK